MTDSAVAAGESDRYWAAVEGADLDAALRVAETVLGRTGSVEAALEGLVVASQRRVGHLWAHGEWTVADEHAATAVNEAVCRRLGLTLPDPAPGQEVLVACVEREWHSLPALVVTLALRSRGVRAELLGANASRDQLLDRILDHGPRAVLLSASLASSLPRVRRQIEAVRGTGTPVVVGGNAFDAAGNRARRLGATAQALTPAEASTLLDSLPLHVAAAPPLRGPGAAEAADLQARAPEIARATLLATFDAVRVPPGEHSPDGWSGVLAGFLPHVVDSLVGALLLEDPTVVVEVRSWLSEALSVRVEDPTVPETVWATLRHELRAHPLVSDMLAAAG